MHVWTCTLLRTYTCRPPSTKRSVHWAEFRILVQVWVLDKNREAKCTLNTKRLPRFIFGKQSPAFKKKLIIFPTYIPRPILNRPNWDIQRVRFDNDTVMIFALALDVQFVIDTSIIGTGLSIIIHQWLGLSSIIHQTMHVWTCTFLRTYTCHPPSTNDEL
jgi:hypothetical protein